PAGPRVPRHASRLAPRRGFYVPRTAADTVLLGVVQEHLETFLAAAAARTGGVGLPRLIERELPGLLRWGVLAPRFFPVPCADCPFARPVPLSCKGRAVCASCGGRRMAEQAANLVQAVLPGSPPGNGSSPCRTGCATALPSTTRSAGPSSGCSCGPCSAGIA